MFTGRLQLIIDPFYSKYESIYPPYNQIYEKKLSIDSLAVGMKEFQERWAKRRKQEEEELQQLRETCHYKHHKIL